MSGRFVRASKFRHVLGEAPKPEGCIIGIKPYTSGDGTYAAASKNFLAILKTGGGGPVYVFNKNDLKRVGSDQHDVNVHKGKCYDIHFSPFNETLLASGSEDGYAKVVQLPVDGNITEDIRDPLCTFTGHQKKVIFVRWNPLVSNCLASTSADHTVRLWDVEAQSEISINKDNNDLIQAMEWSQAGDRLAVTSKDKKIRVFDPRAPDATTVFDGHSGSKCAKLAWADLPGNSGNQGKLFVTGFSKTSLRKLHAYDPRNFGEPISVTDFDQSAGVLVPHYDPDLMILYVAGKGDGFIRLFEIDDEDEMVHHLTDFRSNEPHKGFAFGPKTAVDTSVNEIQRVYRIHKDKAEPIKLKVPRTSDQFQDDLYPETFNGEPGCSLSEWMSGTNPELGKGSILDLISAETEAVNVEVKKSYGELEKENGDMAARLAALEAELKALKG